MRNAILAVAALGALNVAAGTVAKTGAGSLYIDDLSDATTSLTVEDGAVTLRSVGVGEDDLPEGAALHVDISRTNTFKTLTHGSRTRVYDWCDCRGDGYPVLRPHVTTDRSRWPGYDQNGNFTPIEVNGYKLAHFGESSNNKTNENVTSLDFEDASGNKLAYEIDTKDSGVNGVRCRLRTLYNEVVSDERRQLVPGRNTLSLNLRKIPAGDYYLDLIPEVKGLFGAPKCDFAAVRPISKASKLGTLVLATTNMTVIAEGSKACLPVNWDAPLTGAAELEWNVYDTYRQLRFRGMVPLKAWMRSAEVRFDAANFPTLSGTFEVTICAPGANGAVLVSGRKTIFFPNHRFPDYTMIVWESMWESGLHELFAPQSMDVFGYDCHLGEGGWLSAAFNGRAVPHITRVCLGGGRNGTSWNTAPFPGATNAAHRAELDAFRKDANIYRPEIRKLVEEGFTPRVKKCAPFGVSVYNLGDECYYSNDIGFGDAVDDGFFFDYLKTRYGTVEKYNITHKTSIRDFKEVKRLTTDEAQKAGDWPAWFDQVSYAAKMYSDTFQLCRSIIKKYDPKGRVGAEGSPSGNLDETIRNLEFWGPYGDIVKDEVLRSIAPDRVRGMWWGGYLARWGRNGFRRWDWLQRTLCRGPRRISPSAYRPSVAPVRGHRCVRQRNGAP